MEASHTLSQEQKHVLGTVFHFLESMQVYLRSVAPIACETDANLLKGQLEFGEMCMRRLPMYFPELQPLEEERKKRGVSNETTARAAKCHVTARDTQSDD